MRFRLAASTARGWVGVMVPYSHADWSTLRREGIDTLVKDDQQSGMNQVPSRADLADLLRQVNVEEVAAESGLSVKTIYRLRHQMHAPSLDNVAKLVDAVARIKARNEHREAA